MRSPPDPGRQQLQKRARRHLLGSAMIFFSLCVWIRVSRDADPAGEIPGELSPPASAEPAPSLPPVLEEGASYPLSLRLDPDAPAPEQAAASSVELLEALQQELDDCLWAWWTRAPQLRGPLTLELQLGPSGLEAATLEQVSAMPESVERCFTEALLARPWPSLPAPKSWTHTQPFDPEALPGEDP